jgi:hypothetical protein
VGVQPQWRRRTWVGHDALEVFERQAALELGSQGVVVLLRQGQAAQQVVDDVQRVLRHLATR